MRFLIVLMACFAAVDADAARRALLVGINDYSASRLRTPRPYPMPQRDWPDLTGAVNDARTLEEMLLLLYGFERRDVVTLIDQEATRAAILQSLEDLARTARRGDALLFYYAGHGSQMRNSRSDEADRLDESLVPADSRAGARDIRDKELRALFNRILDRGARLTVILDSCHSGSGARGLPPGARPRGVRLDPRDVADPSNGGPRPEERGALVLSATGDDDLAWETRDEQGRMHGAFSWAFIRALRDAAADEPAADTFLRARARLRGEMPLQDPVMAGNREARQSPFLGRGARATGAVVAIEKVRGGGTVLLHGGQVDGLRVGSELQSPRGARLRVTALHGVARAEARLLQGETQAGELLRVPGPMRRMETWSTLRSPEPSPFRLVVRDRAHKDVDGIVGGERYELFLQPVGTRAEQRYVYVFVIDAHGKSVLLFPRGGSVENRFGGSAREIRLAAFEASAPFGVDTYYLLTTDEPLPNPWVLEWEVARTRAPRSALGSLSRWSLERRLIPSAGARR